MSEGSGPGWRAIAGGAQLHVRASPGAARDGVDEFLDPALALTEASFLLV